MPGPEAIHEPENPKEGKRYTPEFYWQQQQIYQQAMEKGDDENPLLTFAAVLAAQMLVESPTTAALKKQEKDGKTAYVYRADEPMGVLRDLADETYKDPYFRMWAADKTPEDLRQAAKEPGKALMEVREVQKQTEKHYTDLGKRGAEVAKAGSVSGVQKEARSFYEAMQATGTGRNWLGVKRKSNSKEYDAMMEAMGKAVNDGPDNETPEQRAQNLALAVAATKKYLADKKTVRKTEDGATRWENSMKFLCSAMPAEEFKAYCAEVNEARGEKDQITPEQFVPPRTAERTVEVIQQEVRDKGEITVHDAAKVAAAYHQSIYLDDDGEIKLDTEEFQDSEISQVDLETRTLQFAESAVFVEWFVAQGQDVLKEDMTVGHDGVGARIGHWQDPRPQDVELTVQLVDKKEAQEEAKKQEEIRRKQEEIRRKEAAQARKDAEKAKKDAEKAKRQAFLTRLKQEKPRTYQILKQEHDVIMNIKEVNPNLYEQKMADFDKKMKGLLEEDRKRQADKDKDKDKDKQKKQEPQGPHKEKPKGGPVAGG